jgi:WD40 repeat protein
MKPHVAFAASLVALAVASRLPAQTTSRLSVRFDGHSTTRQSFFPSVSFDGRYTAFESLDVALVPNDTNFVTDVFVHDRLTGGLTRVSLTTSDAEFADASTLPAISSDGRFVTFESDAPSRYPAIWLRDRDVRGDGVFDEPGDARTEMVSVGALGEIPNAAVTPFSSMSPDGRYVAFASAADNLVAGDTNTFQCALDPNDTSECIDVFVRDRLLGTTSRVSVASDGTQSDRGCDRPSISADGRFVTFESEATTLVPGAGNGWLQVFVHDRATAATALVSVDAAGHAADRDSLRSTISGDGRWVVFESAATNWGPHDFQSAVWVHDRDADSDGVFDEPGAIANVRIASGSWAHMSTSGRVLLFRSPQSDLVPDDTNGAEDLFVWDRDADEDGILDEPGEVSAERVNVDYLGRQVQGSRPGAPGTGGAAISGNERFVAFDSADGQFVPDDENGILDVFLRDRRDCASGSVGVADGMPDDVLFVDGIAHSASGRFVAVAPRTPIVVSLQGSSSGPIPASYVLWVWRGPAASQFFVNVSGETVGCVVNPTPVHPRLPPPQPFRCVLGGLGAEFCGATHRFAASPASAPWTVTHRRGLPAGTTLTLQGLIQDSGASNSRGLGVTNAVVVSIQ